MLFDRKFQRIKSITEQTALVSNLLHLISSEKESSSEVWTEEEFNAVRLQLSIIKDRGERLLYEISQGRA
jgi:hypothetical protein